MTQFIISCLGVMLGLAIKDAISAVVKGMRRKRGILPAGTVIAYCIDCGGEAIADGKGSPPKLEHANECPGMKGM